MAAFLYIYLIFARAAPTHFYLSLAQNIPALDILIDILGPLCVVVGLTALFVSVWFGSWWIRLVAILPGATLAWLAYQFIESASR